MSGIKNGILFNDIEQYTDVALSINQSFSQKDKRMVVEDGCKRLFSGLIFEILYAVGQGKFYIYHRKVSKFRKTYGLGNHVLKCSF